MRQPVRRRAQRSSYPPGRAAARDPRYLRTRQGVAQIALFNEITGRTYLLSGGPDTQYTASIVKADIMALWLWRYQSRTGTVPDNMPYRSGTCCRT